MAPRPVYSVQLASLASFVGTHTVAVPDGVRFVVRDIDTREETGDTNATAYVTNAAGGIMVIWAVSDPAGVRYFQWQGRQVFNPGESFSVHTVIGQWSIQISGYELTVV